MSDRCTDLYNFCVSNINKMKMFSYDKSLTKSPVTSLINKIIISRYCGLCHSLTHKLFCDKTAVGFGRRFDLQAVSYSLQCCRLPFCDNDIDKPLKNAE